MIGSVELITPAIAQAMLAKAAQNRPVTASLIRRYSEEMRRGRWNTNGQGIIFDPDGNLLDGQHRLRALIEAEMSVEMFVVRGVPAERFETMDSGRARTTGDVLGAEGYTNANNVAAIARLSWNYVAGASISYGPSKIALLNFVHAHPYLVEVTTKVKAARAPIPLSPLGAVLFLANAGHQRLEGQADDFLEGLRTGANLTKSDPRLTLRDWFFQQASKTRTTVAVDAAFAAVARSWNAFAQGRELAIIKNLYGPNRRSLVIYDWDPDHFSGVDDMQAKIVDTAMANLSKAPSHQKQA